MDSKLNGEIVPYLHASVALRAPSRFIDYVAKGGREKVQGWVTGGALSAVTAFNALQRRLGVKGHVCEIGVHHGRFCIALSLLRQLSEKSLAIDVFDMQEFNVDHSGKGDRRAFDRNVDFWLSPDADVIVMRADSLRIRSKDVIEALGGKVRLFSVDGSDTSQHTLNDILICEQSLVPGGLVVVDDFLNPAWPGVVEAVMRYIDGPDHEMKLAPVGYGDNKFYFTTKSHITQYRALLHGWLRAALATCKPVVLAGAEMLYFSFSPAERMLAETRVIPKAFLSGATDSEQALAVLGAPTKRENSGTWLIGECAGVALDLSMTPSNSALRLTFETRPFPREKNSKPRIDIYAFDRPISDLEVITDKDVTRFVLSIKRKDFGTSDRLEVWFHNPKATSPSALGLSNDNRCLSLLLRGLTVEASSSTTQH